MRWSLSPNVAVSSEPILVVPLGRGGRDRTPREKIAKGPASCLNKGNQHYTSLKLSTSTL